MKQLFDTRYIISFGLLMFAIAFLDLIIYNPTQWQDWFSSMRIWGKIATVMLCVSLIWLIVSTVIKNKV